MDVRRAVRKSLTVITPTPILSVLVCANQRSGSTMLCRGLADTGVAGRPEEYFLDGDPQYYPPDQRFWEDSPLGKQYGAQCPQDYLDAVLRAGSTPNRVFGAKLQWNVVEHFLNRLEGIPHLAGLDRGAKFTSVFPGLRAVHLRRRDRVRQAVSWARADQEGVWVVSADEPANPKAAPTFDARLIGNLEQLLERFEHEWEELFAELNLTPVDVYYEDLVADFGGTVAGVLDILGLGSGAAVVAQPRTFKQSDDLNEEWVSRYLAVREVRSSATN